MKWLSVNTGSLNENFELWDDERKLAEISFTKGTRIARFVSSISRRIFFFEKKPFFSEKPALMIVVHGGGGVDTATEMQ